MGFFKMGSVLLNRDHWPHKYLSYTFGKHHLTVDDVQAEEPTSIPWLHYSVSSSLWCKDL